MVLEAVPGASGLLGVLGSTWRSGLGLARWLPGADLVERAAADLERTAADLERTIAAGARQWLEVDRRDPDEPVEEPPEPTLRERMGELLQRSATRGREEAQQELHAGILDALTPDEARLLAGFADGTAYPVVHVAEGAAVTLSRRFALRNACTAGRATGVTLLDEVPHYLTRLHHLGLIEFGGPLEGRDDEYELLQTESRVRAVLRQTRSPRVVRRSARLSGLGARFWERCGPAPT